MSAIRLVIPPKIDISTDEGLRLLREANPVLLIERTGTYQISIATIDTVGNRSDGDQYDHSEMG